MTNYFFIILFILILPFGKNQNYCDKSQDCQNCTFCHEHIDNVCLCNFENGYCKHENGFYFSKDFLRHYNGCIKNNGKNESMCGGISNIELYDKYLYLNLHPIYPNLLCYYNFNYLFIDNRIINITLGKFYSKYKFYIYLITSNNEIFEYSYLSFNSSYYDLIIKTKKFSLYIDILEPGHYLSLYITVIKNVSENITYISDSISDSINNPPSSSRNMGIIIVIIIIIIVSILISIVIVILLKKYWKKKPNEPSTNQNMVEIMKGNKEKMEILYQNELETKIYNKKMAINNCYNCAICKENFIENSSQIIITKCNHIFHSNCLKIYVSKNYICPKCPTCNSLFLGQESEIDYSQYNLPSIIKANSNIII